MFLSLCVCTRYKGRRGYHIVMHHLPPSRERPASFPFDRTVWACGYACVGHAYAEHLWGPWHYSPVPAANNSVTFTDGITVTMASRERPQVLTDTHGDVMVLYNGVSDPSRADGGTHLTYTLATPTVAYRSDAKFS